MKVSTLPSIQDDEGQDQLRKKKREGGELAFEVDSEELRVERDSRDLLPSNDECFVSDDGDSERRSMEREGRGDFGPGSGEGNHS